MRQLNKPDFRGPAAYWVDPNYLPESLTVALKQILQGPPKPSTSFTPEQATDFLTACAITSQAVNDMEEKGTPGEMQRELLQASAKAKDLLRALSELQENSATQFHLMLAELCTCRDFPFHLNDPQGRLQERQRLEDGRALGCMWDLLEDFSKIAEYTSTKLDPMVSTGNKPSVWKARRLVHGVIEAHKHITGKLPPKSKDTWFLNFMAKLAAWDGLKMRNGTPLKCGADLVASVIDEIRRSH